MKKTVTFLFAILLWITGCNFSNYSRFDPVVFNLWDLNTEYDDYNSAPPEYFGLSNKILYSNNVYSKGGQYDLSIASVSFIEAGDQGLSSYRMGRVDVEGVNTPYNEFGPYLMNKPQYPDKDINFDGLLFASDRSGDLDIYMYHPYLFNVDEISLKTTIKPLAFNTSANEAYPTYDEKRGWFYFSSDREGSYDIFRFPVPTGTNSLLSFLTDPAFDQSRVEKITALSSDAEDRCPYIYGDLMFLVSNRSGSRGGYDLYLSRFKNGEWTRPANLQDVADRYLKAGEESLIINTSSDEFRPSVSRISSNYCTYKNYVVFFSSNRPDGKGGFDLHMMILPEEFN